MILTEEMIDEKLASRKIDQQKAAAMGEKTRREFLTFDELKAEIVDWSWDTVKRRIANEGFPCVKDGAGYLFPRDKVILWFKKREVQS